MKKRLGALLVGPIALGWRDVRAQKQTCLGSLGLKEFEKRRLGLAVVKGLDENTGQGTA